MITTIMSLNYHNNIYKIIIQYYFFNNISNVIRDLPDLNDFTEYLKLSSYFHYDVSYNINHFETIHFFTGLLLKQDLCSYSKLCTLYELICNKFSNKDDKNQIINHFYKIQRTYYSLLKFSNICKQKILKPNNVYDLLCNNIDQNKCFKIIHYNKLYLFSYSDLINIFITKIAYCDNYFFSQPKYILNPYNQTLFNLPQLYKMYFYIKKCNILKNKIMLIDNFFFCNFNLIDYSKNNESDIAKYNINRFIKNEPYCNLYPYIKELIKYSNENLLPKSKYRINYDRDFPKTVLCDIFKPYLYYYLNHTFNVDTVYRYHSTSILKKKIFRFAKNSLKFGRKTFQLKKKQPTFNTEHIDFYKNDIITINIDYSKIDSYNINSNDCDSDTLSDSETSTTITSMNYNDSDDYQDDVILPFFMNGIQLNNNNNTIIQTRNSDTIIQTRNSNNINNQFNNISQI